MFKQQMEMQQQLQKQMLLMIQKNDPPEAPKTPAFATPVLPKKNNEKISPQKEGSPFRRSPRLQKLKAEKAEPKAEPKDEPKGEPMKRTLSWSDAFVSGKRAKKPEKVQKL